MQTADSAADEQKDEAENTFAVKPILICSQKQ
jgi:hypothetical protein